MPRIVRDQVGSPLVVDMNVGESTVVNRHDRAVEIMLRHVREHVHPDRWLVANERRVLFAWAAVELEVDGIPRVLEVRPYELPIEVAGLRVYGELTRSLCDAAELVPVGPFDHDVRISIGTAGEPWFSGEWAFPLREYRWHASSYRNTWNALVPYNLHYHHRGEDFGAIPDVIPVQACHAGEVVQCPGDAAEGSNSVVLRGDDGWETTYSHMNLESILPSVRPGNRLPRGRRIGTTGETWRGQRRQHIDPHLHVGGAWQGHKLSCYPALVEAYLRDYPDELLAVAGGHAFTLPGQPITLDGTRSIGRTSDTSFRKVWTTSDGRQVEGPVHERVYDAPGHYVERLTIYAADGAWDFDHLQVRVYDPERGPGDDQALAYGWCYHTPVRGIAPGDDVLFWSRMRGAATPVEIDFGDGSPPRIIAGECQHRYRRPGYYDVRLRSRSLAGHPFETAMKVVIEDES